MCRKKRTRNTQQPPNNTNKITKNNRHNRNNRIHTKSRPRTNSKRDKHHLPMKKDQTLPILYRLLLLGSTFSILVILKNNLLQYQQIYYQYLTLINNLGEAALQSTEGIAQAQTLINQFTTTTNYYTLLVLWILPSLLLISYLFWEYLTWKKILELPLKTSWWKFLIINIISLALLAGTISILWNKIDFHDYTFDTNLLWIPITAYIIHTLQLASYTTLKNKPWITKKTI